MKQRILRVVSMILVVICLVFSVCDTTFAYTEEEKEQAKAWLSAHGYSPDMNGANQAYEDYLNGKFDEELGVDTNGDGYPSSEESTEQNTSEESNTSTEEEKGATAAGQEDGANADSKGKEKTKKKKPGESDSDTAHQTTGEDVTINLLDAGSDLVDESGETTDTAQEQQPVDGEEKTVAGCLVKPAKLSRELITFYRPERMEQYKEACGVIGASILLAIVVELLISLRR